MKKIIFLLILAVIPFIVSAQQITKFAVVDTAQVYRAYFRESSAVRNYEAKKAEFQQEITELTQELKNLQTRKIEAQNRNDSSQVFRLESEISKKATYLTEYTRAKNIELENLEKRLESSNDFYSLLYSVIAKIAESDGYSMVLSLQQADAVLWYSPSVDITEKVITALATER